MQDFIEKKKDKKPHKNTDKNSEFKIPVPVRNKVFKAPPGFKPPPGFVPPLGFVVCILYIYIHLFQIQIYQLHNIILY